VGVVLGIGGIVDGTAEDIEHTSIDRGGLKIAELVVKFFGGLALEVVDRGDADISQILSNPIAHTRYIF
jgi:hypothetical protein